ncbi:uncharacterized protein [Antedon mediterranea]|uniref:uncharacterized protein n=1 Tax=Antedon mediterranea TaxID=105859 RepID=UPI003AF4552E
MFDGQYGFTPGKSCSSVLAEATTSWVKALDNGAPRIDVVALDYSRAFDSISHDILVNKLSKTYGVGGVLLKWINSFLSGRKQRRDINKISEWSILNKLILNPTKCNILSIDRRRAPSSNDYVLNEQVIAHVKHLKILGVYISDDLSWSKQVHEVVNKCNRTLGLWVNHDNRLLLRFGY